MADQRKQLKKRIITILIVIAILVLDVCFICIGAHGLQKLKQYFNNRFSQKESIYEETETVETEKIHSLEEEMEELKKY